MNAEAEAARGQFNRQNGNGEYETGVILLPDQSVRSYLQDNGLIKQLCAFDRWDPNVVED